MIDSLLKGWRKSGPLGAMALHALASYKRIKSTSDNVWPSRDTFLHRLVWLPRSGQQGLLCACLDLWRRMRNLCIPWKNLLLCNPSRASPESEIPCRQLLGHCSHETQGIAHGVHLRISRFRITEERLVGKTCVSMCRIRRWSYHLKKK